MPVTLNEVLESAMNLDDASREQLLDILQKREIERKRQKLANDAREAEAEYRSGKTVPGSGQDVVDTLGRLED